jgi:hypothetical protein
MFGSPGNGRRKCQRNAKKTAGAPTGECHFYRAESTCVLAGDGFRVSSGNVKYSVNGILQSSFRPSSRRETFGRHSKGGRRDGGLKIDWTKPLPSAWPMCIDRDLGSRVRM